MADAVLVLLLLLALGAAALLAVRALRHWYGQRAGRAYELPVDHRGTLLRAGASGVAALLAATVAVPLLHDAAAPVRTRAVAAHEPDAVPSPPAGTPQPAPPPPELRVLGHPAAGTLQELRDGTRVWLPPRYSTPSAADVAYPVVIVHTSAAGSSADSDLYPAFAGQATRGRANSFLLVAPPACATDSAAVLAEVAARYRTLTARTAHGVIGVGPQAPCAVREALSHPDRYAAAVGISGDYPAMTRPTARYPSLLLASVATETEQRASAVRLRTALRPPTADQVRLLDGVPRRQDLTAQVAAYLTEKLDGPTRTPTAHLTPTPGSPFAPTVTPPGTARPGASPSGTASSRTAAPGGAPHSVPGPTSARTSAPGASAPSAPTTAASSSASGRSGPTTHTPATAHEPATHAAPASTPAVRRTPPAPHPTPSPRSPRSPHAPGPHTSKMPSGPRRTP